MLLCCGIFGIFCDVAILPGPLDLFDTFLDLHLLEFFEFLAKIIIALFCDRDLFHL